MFLGIEKPGEKNHTKKEGKELQLPKLKQRLCESCSCSELVLGDLIAKDILKYSIQMYLIVLFRFLLAIQKIQEDKLNKTPYFLF